MRFLKFAGIAVLVLSALSSCSDELKYTTPEAVDTIEVGKRSVYFSPEQNSVKISVNASAQWKAEALQGSEWLSVISDAEGFTVTSGPNTGELQRKGAVRVSTPKRFVDVSVIQYAVPQGVDYYCADPATATWSASLVHYVLDEDGKVVGVFTKEYSKYHLYPAPGGVPDYTSGVQSDNSALFISADGSKVYASDPHTKFEVLKDASFDPLVLVSNVKSHGAVKVGTQIWLAEDYKTTKLKDGTQIAAYVDSDAYWPNETKAVVVYNDGERDHYLYSSYAIGWSTGATFDPSIFAPEGWRVPSRSEYLETLIPFVENYENLSVNSGFGATSNFKVTSTSGKVKASALNYTNTWTCTPTGAKAYMCGLKPDGATVDSGQALTAVFSVRLIKE